MASFVSGKSKKAGTGKWCTVDSKAPAAASMIAPAYGMPVVVGLAAPLSWTTAEPGAGRGTNCPTTAATVFPHAMPSTVSGSIQPETRRPATRATCSSR
jgi:hypothetical protein